MPAAAAIKVLIVDDQMSLRCLVRAGLQEIGFKEFTEACDGEDGLRSMLRQPAHLVISDFNMPRLDGLGLLRAVRGHPAVRKLPFILITGRGDRELVVTAAQAGVNNYLVKPFTEAMLREKMEQVMGKLS